MIPRYAVVTTYNRPDVALDCIGSIGHQADTIFVVDNGDEKPMPEAEDTLTPYYLLPYPEQPVNLSRLWNLGIRAAAADAERMGVDKWDVAIFNDDCIVPGDWFVRVQAEMRHTTAVACCTGPLTHFTQQVGAVPLHMRLTGWAFMLRGEAALLADEQFEWWCGDDDIDWTARQRGGMLMIRGGAVTNRFPNGYTTGHRAERIAVDMENFVAKWGQRAW